MMIARFFMYDKKKWEKNSSKDEVNFFTATTQKNRDI
jgi:hypothetical protein